MSNLRIAYTPRSDASMEGEIAVLANAYSFVRRCAEEKKKGGPETAPDDAMKGSDNDRTTTDYTRP